MIIPPIPELKIIGVVDPGIPNQERIIFQPVEAVNTAQFVVCVGHKSGKNWQILDNLCCWLGEAMLKPPTWFVLYTGMGKASVLTDNLGNPIHVRYWGQGKVLFDPNRPDIAPVIVRVGGFAIAPIIPVSAKSTQGQLSG
jgi:hypothetical protein